MKPKAQRMQPGGIDAHKAMGGDKPLTHAVLMRIAALPAFQKFVREEHPDPEFDAVGALSQNDTQRPLLDEYERWHEVQGLWPNETPYGEVK